MRSRRHGIVGAAALVALWTLPAAGQLQTTDLTQGLSAEDLVQTLLGEEITVQNVSITGAGICAGVFTGGDGIIGFESGVVLSSGSIANVIGPNVSDGITADNGNPGDPDLDALVPGFFTNDACILEFEFECETLQVISFNYVFSSDEYNEYVDSEYNDVFGFFVNGVNIALVPGSNTPVAINNVNCGDPYNPPVGGPNCDLFINNDLSDGGGAIDTEMDGLTIVFSATANVNPGFNTIKLAIADAGDFVLDSNVFLEAGSFVCAPPEGTASLDIKPGSCPNSFNRQRKGVLPIALLGSDSFDVFEVDLSSLVLARADGLGGSIAPLAGPNGPGLTFEDVATPFDGEPCDCHKLGGDGLMDLSMKFSSQGVVAELELNDFVSGEAVELIVTGTKLDGSMFIATDCLRLVQ